MTLQWMCQMLLKRKKAMKICKWNGFFGMDYLTKILERDETLTLLNLHVLYLVFNVCIYDESSV